MLIDGTISKKIFLNNDKQGRCNETFKAFAKDMYQAYKNGVLFDISTYLVVTSRINMMRVYLNGKYKFWISPDYYSYRCSDYDCLCNCSSDITVMHLYMETQITYRGGK